MGYLSGYAIMQTLRQYCLKTTKEKILFCIKGGYMIFLYTAQFNKAIG